MRHGGVVRGAIIQVEIADNCGIISVGAYVANINARGQLMLILGIMHNLEVYAIVIQKMMVPFLKINFDTILTRLNITHEMTNRPLDIFFRNRHILPKHIHVGYHMKAVHA